MDQRKTKSMSRKNKAGKHKNKRNNRTNNVYIAFIKT